MGKLYDIVQGRIDSTGVTEATLARRMGTSPQTINSWKTRGVRRLPEKWLLVALAREVGVRYVDVLDAALHDIRYLPEESDPRGDTAPMRLTEADAETVMTDSELPTEGATPPPPGKPGSGPS